MAESGFEHDVFMMICTAGHVDHGKTQLVRMLTGCNTDRLKTEQERGLTIELGFAPCILGDGLCVGIVDVPGHEKFIKNMVAGVSGIEMTILVIAANDGIMPQTIEHLHIMELLGVSHGIVALTKTDLVSGERVQEVTGEIGALLDGTFMEGAPVCPVSSETFDGYPEFYTVLVANIQKLSKRKRSGVFRMPVAHVFTQKGFGIVVMGVPVDGTIGIGTQVEIVPGGQTGKVRAIQQFLRDTDAGEYGQCLALNIPEFSKKPPVRGQVVCLPGYLEPGHSFHARITAVHGLQIPLRNAEEVKFHTGTVEETGKIYLLEDDILREGKTGLATVVTSNPVVAAVHDRFIIRRPSPAATVAGGEILAVSQEAKKPRKRFIVDRLAAYTTFLQGIDPMSAGGMEKRCEYFLLQECAGEAPLHAVSKWTLLAPETALYCLSRLIEQKKVLQPGPDSYIHADRYATILKEVERRLERAVSEEGMLNITLTALQQGADWSPQLLKKIQDDLRQKNLIQRRGNTLILETAVEQLSDRDRCLMEKIVKTYEETGFVSPRPDELPGLLGDSQNNIERLVDYLCSRNRLIRLSKNVIIDHDAFVRAQEIVVNIISRDDVLDSAEFKLHIGSTRKYALAILDFLDARRVTVRAGNNRTLNPDFKRNLIT